MGTQNQTPGSQHQQPGTRQPGNAERDEQRDPKTQRAKGKEAGNVPRSDDDVMDEDNEGTREDGAGRNS